MLKHGDVEQPARDGREGKESAADASDAPIDWSIVGIAGVLVAAIVAWGLAAPEHFGAFASTALDFVVYNFGWAYVLFGTIFVVFVLVVAFSRFGTLHLGAVDEEPEFSTLSWISMMFAAGMGIGLMFYGVSEPLGNYRNGMPGHEAVEVGASMAHAMFHWTLHPWAVYAIVGLAIAYSTFRVGRKQLLSQAFIPLIGERGANGWPGRVIDILSIFATIFGTACSLGLGALQIQAGLEASGLIDSPSKQVVVGIVAVLTLAFILSAMSGVGKGIQYLSNTNMVLAALLAIFVFILGPTVTILNLIPGSVGNYLQYFTEMIGRTAESNNGEAAEWLGTWTIFYWAWWVSWSPFVGMFLARISRGRTIREFCIGVLVVPSGLIAAVLLGTFFITSADSASTVMGSMSQNGTADANPFLSAAWGALTALVGLTLLLTDENALSNLQNVTIVAALPFLFIVVALMPAIIRDLRNDIIYLDYREAQAFQRKLARERRLHREYQCEQMLKARRAEMLGLNKLTRQDK